MLCDDCKKNEATIHVTNIVNGKKTESHLCQDCANKKEHTDMFKQLHQSFGQFPKFSNFGSFGQLGSSIFDNDFFNNDFFTNAVYPDGLLQDSHSQRCDQCGMTFDEFNRTGKFGCDHCYEVFDQEITPLVKRLQGSLAYEGRVPSRGTGVFKTRHQIKRLRQELNKAIKGEDYEKAITLRDQIKQLEDSLHKDAGTKTDESSAS